jgi:hypothetical protein
MRFVVLMTVNGDNRLLLGDAAKPDRSLAKIRRNILPPSSDYLEMFT